MNLFFFNLSNEDFFFNFFQKFRDFFNHNDTSDPTRDTCVILTVEGRTFPVDIFYLQRFDSPCIFSEGDWKTRSVRWAEKQLRLLAASRAVCQADEQGHVCP